MEKTKRGQVTDLALMVVLLMDGPFVLGKVSTYHIFLEKLLICLSFGCILYVILKKLDFFYKQNFFPENVTHRTC